LREVAPLGCSFRRVLRREKFETELMFILFAGNLVLIAVVAEELLQGFEDVLLALNLNRRHLRN
jgi:hypothetical protein